MIRFVPPLATLALLVASPALAETKTVPATAVFQFLDKYDALPAAERSRFALRYRLRGKDGKSIEVKATLIDGGTETPLPVAADGGVDRLPTAGELARKAQVRIEAAAEVQSSLSPEALVRIGPEVSVPDLLASAAQLTTAVKSMAGVIGFMVPKFTRAVFPKAEGAVLVGADGREAPLPLVRNTPSLDLTTASGARAVRFAKPPAHIYLAPPAK